MVSDPPPPPWTQDQLQQAIKSLKDQIGGWQVVWGPGYAADWGGGQANAIFVAQQLDASDQPQPVYVVAIAGTNAASKFDGFEDMCVNLTPWELNSTDPQFPYPQVTFGDMSGLTNLLKIQWPGNMIRDFLKSIPNKKGVTLWFTGHSLGGALAPMLMLALMDKNSKGVDANSTQLSLWGQVNLLATAGPSIGNQDFVGYFGKVLGAANTSFIWNGHDVVPHAWNEAAMSELNQTSFYNIDLTSSPCVGPQIVKAQQAAQGKGYTLFQSQPAFSVGVQDYGDKTNPDWTPDSKYMAQLGFQHLNAYVNTFDCPWLGLLNPCYFPSAAKQAADALCSSKKASDSRAAAGTAAGVSTAS
jgi:hypothetical protein